MNFKKKYINLIIILFSLYVNSNAAAINNKIIMTVGDRAITSIDLINEITLLNIINNGALAEEKQETLEKIGIDSLIRKLIQKNEISKYEYYHYSVRDLNDRIKLIEKNLNLNRENLIKVFNSNEVNFNLLEDKIVTELQWNGLIFQLYKNKITIDFDQINKTLNDIKNKKFNNEYLLSEILFKPKDFGKLDDEIKKIKTKIKNEGFEKVALRISISSTSKGGGKLGWLKETEISEKFRKTIEKTSVGSLTEHLIVPEGVIIMKVNNKRQVERKIDIGAIKNKLVSTEKLKKLKMFSVLHFRKIKISTLISTL